MTTRKEMKQAARQSLKKHYLIFVAICLIAAFLGTEFTSSLDAVKSYSKEAEVTVNTNTGLTTGSRGGLLDVLEELLLGNMENSKALSEKIEQARENHEPPDKNHGYLAPLVNSVTSGSLFVTTMSAVNSFVGSTNITFGIMVVLAVILLFAVWFFLINIYQAVSRRLFLEGRCYESVPIDRFLFILRVKKWVKASATMFLRFFYLCLWSLTLVGCFIKYYSYFLTPYIVAENPDISPKKAITLSRKMMYGHKWECFRFELTYLGWDILGIFTFGLSAILYSNPYRVAAFSEYYAELRKEAKEKKIKDIELLNDIYLFEQPREEVITENYQDVIAIMEHTEEVTESFGRIRSFLANQFGLLLTNSSKEKRYEQHEADKIRIKKLTDDVERKSYPGRLFSIPEKEKRARLESLYYMRHYSIWSLILIFFAFALVGWVWEVSLHLMTGDGFVKRGVLHGPWLPIYGVGSVLILTLLYKVRKSPVCTFGCTVILCGTIEYFTSYVLELIYGQVWWDYSGYFLNLNGRICAEGLLIFGIGGMFVVYILAPLLDNFIKKMKLKLLIPLSLALAFIFLGDLIYSSYHPNTGKGITDYDKGAALQLQIHGATHEARTENIPKV